MIFLFTCSINQVYQENFVFASLILSDECLRAFADEVGAAGLDQGFAHFLAVLGLVEMEQGALQALFFLAPGDVDLLHGQRVDAGVVHAGGDCARCGVEILHLVGDKALLVEILGQLNGGLQVAARVGGDQVGYQILLLAYALVLFFEHGLELLIDLGSWFAHQIQYPGTDVLRRNLELAADVVLTQFMEEGGVGVCDQVVEPYSRLDEDFFYAREGPEFAQEFQVILMGDLQVGAGPWEEAPAVGACARSKLFFAGWLAEVGGGAAHIIYVALEIGLLGQPYGLVYDGLVASRLDNTTLVEGEGAEVAASEAAPGADKAEFYLLNGRDTSLLLVAWVISPHIR